MTATRLSEKVITERVASIREMLSAIRRLPLDSVENFRADDRTVGAAESYLRRALEALMDLGRHMLAKGFGAAASEYREIPRRLQEIGVLPVDVATRMGELAGYRNRMVHFYHLVSDKELYDICAHQLHDVDAVVEALLRWIAEHPERIDRSL